MKTMKNVLMVLLSLALVLSMAGAVAADVTADAATTDKTETSEIAVSYQIIESFEVTIPAGTITFTDDTTLLQEQDLQSVTVTKNRISPNTYLKISLTSAKGYKLENSNDVTSTIPYTVTYTATGSANTVPTEATVLDSNTGSTATVILAQAAGTNNAATVLKLKVVDGFNVDTLKVGTYLDTLTFSIDIEA